jgi:molecular chaperone HscB
VNPPYPFIVIVVHLQEMNYYELFGFPVGFSIDQAALKKRFFELSRQYHPDYFAQSDADAQAEALEQSAMVNKGYRTFSDPERTMQYLLELKGLVEAEEKYSLDPMFLAEVMELNEQLMELEFEPDPAALDQLAAQTETLSKNIYHDVEGIMAGYQEGTTAKEALLPVKEYYYQKKYLQRILDKIAALRNIAPRA